MHEDIKARKTFEEITSSPEEFEKLLGMVLLFNRDSPYFKYSGWVRAAVLNAQCPCCDKVYSFMAFSQTAAATKPEDMMMIQLSSEELKAIIFNCDAFIGLTLEESFLLSVNDSN